MQRLARPETLKSAFLAASGSVLLSYPRLWLWHERPKALWFMLAMLFLCSMVLWGFVFAWLPLAIDRPVSNLRARGKDWLIAGISGVTGAILLRLVVDPVLRTLRPDEYPANPGSWVAQALFNLGFTQLVLCFAPFSFFYRLTGRRAVAVPATVAFGSLLVGLQLRELVQLPSPLFTAGLFLLQVASSAVGLFVLRRGGPILVWAFALLVQMRLLPELLLG